MLAGYRPDCLNCARALTAIEDSVWRLSRHIASELAFHRRACRPDSGKCRGGARRVQAGFQQAVELIRERLAFEIAAQGVMPALVVAAREPPSSLIV